MGNVLKMKLLIGFIVISLLLIVGLVIFNTISRNGKVPVSVNVFPADAQAALDNQPVKNGIYYLKAGTYTVTSSRNGFEKYSQTVKINDSARTVAILMTPVSNEAKKIVSDNTAEYNRVQAKVEQAVTQNSKDFYDRNPIVKKLPYKKFFYSVGYRMDQSDPSGNSIIIEIDATEGYRQSALYGIRQLGYDPTDFTINFRNYENPFPL